MNSSHIIDDYDSREDWLAARATFIGASESPAILGHGYSGQNALTVYASKIKPEESAIEATRAMVVGSLIEPGLCRVFEHFQQMPAWQERAYRVRRHADHPFIAATLDAITSEQTLGEIPVELKNVSGTLIKQWDEENVAPLKYQIQCSHQMLVTGAPKAYLFGLIGGNNPVIREIPRNDKFISILKTKLIDFWGFVERRELPEDYIDWCGDATADAIRALHPDDNGETITLPPESADWLEQLEAAKAKIKEADEIKTAAENRLKAAIGDNTFGVLPTGVTLSLKSQSRKEYVAKACTYRVLRVTK